MKKLEQEKVALNNSNEYSLLHSTNASENEVKKVFKIKHTKSQSFEIYDLTSLDDSSYKSFVSGYNKMDIDSILDFITPEGRYQYL